MKHPWVFATFLFWIVLAIWPKLLFGKAMEKQNPTKVRIALLVLGVAEFLFWRVLT
ncbi:MAG: hypothetical protein ACRD3E_05260 [Terriglobales bacterium]